MRRAIVIVLAACLGSALPAAADWLVLDDGTRIETRGPWEVRGRQVVFTSARGALQALRLDEVDLEASRAANEAPAAEAPQAEKKTPEKRRPEPVLVITDADVARAAPPDTVVEEGGESEDEATPTAGEAPEELAIDVTRWQEVTLDEGGLELRGDLVNRTGAIVTDLGLEVTVSDTSGATLGKVRAFVEPSSIQPGGAAKFRALFPDLATFAGEPEFKVTGRPLVIQLRRPAEGSNPPGEDAAGEPVEGGSGAGGAAPANLE